jgi:hypothetical protein
MSTVYNYLPFIGPIKELFSGDFTSDINLMFKNFAQDAQYETLVHHLAKSKQDLLKERLRSVSVDMRRQITSHSHDNDFNVQQASIALQSLITHTDRNIATIEQQQNSIPPLALNSPHIGQLNLRHRCYSYLTGSLLTVLIIIITNVAFPIFAISNFIYIPITMYACVTSILRTYMLSRRKV